MKKAELDEQPVDLRSILSQHSPSTQQMKALPNHAGPVFDLPSNPIITFVAPTPVRIHSPITFDTADVEDSKSTNSGEGGKVDKLTPCKSKRSKLSVSFNHCNKKPYDKRHQSPAAPPILMEPAGQPQPSTSSAVASYHPSSYYYMSSTSTFDQRMMDHRNEPNTYPMIEYPQSNYQQYQADDYQDYEEYPAPYEDYQPNDSVEYSTDFHDEAQRHQSDTGNQYGNVIILDWCDPQKLRRSVEILSATALHHHLLMKFVYRKCERFQYVRSYAFYYTIVMIVYIVFCIFSHTATAQQNWSALCRPLRDSRQPARNSHELWPALSCWTRCSSTATPSNRNQILPHGRRFTLIARSSKSIDMPTSRVPLPAAPVIQTTSV